MLNKIITIGLILLLLPFSGPIASAVSGVNKPKDCTVAERSENWGSFLTSIVGYDGFTEFWKDIFTRNYCHQYDIDIAQGKLDKLREQIRKAFYTCNNGKARQLEQTYREMFIELNYLRKFADYVSGDIVLNQNVRNELKSMIVDKKKWYSEKDFNEIYEDAASKYDISKYQECEDDVWAELSEKWDEFKEVFSGEEMKEIFWNDKAENRFKKAAQAPPGKSGDFWSGRVNMRLNNVPPEYGKSFFSELFSKEELDDIGDEILNNIPVAGTSSLDEESRAKIEALAERDISVYKYIDAMRNEEQRYSREENQARMIAEYEFLYKDVSDSIIDALTEKIQTLHKTINETYPIIDKVKTCSTKIRDKQCANK